MDLLGVFGAFGSHLCNPFGALIDPSRLHQHPTGGLKSEEPSPKQPLIPYCFHHSPTNFTTRTIGLAIGSYKAVRAHSGRPAAE